MKKVAVVVENHSTFNKVLEQNMVGLFGEKGQRWIHQLPTLLEEIITRYRLSDVTSFTNLTYNYVFKAQYHGKHVVVKLSLDEESLSREYHALEAFSGHGALKVLEKERALLILERAIPGDSLKSMWPQHEHEAIHVAVDLIQKLHCAPTTKPSAFPSIHDWLKSIDKNLDAIPSEYLEKARSLKKYLLATTEEPKLLHGDFHHDNILRHNGQWIAIDPKGVIGDPTVDLCCFIRNPVQDLLTQPDCDGIIDNRIHTFSTILQLPKDRITQWCFVESILSWVWNIEDNLDVDFSQKWSAFMYTLLK